MAVHSAPVLPSLTQAALTHAQFESIRPLTTRTRSQVYGVSGLLDAMDDLHLRFTHSAAFDSHP